MTINAVRSIKYGAHDILSRAIFSLFSEKASIKLQYFLRLHRFPNLKQPRTLTEKIQYRKLYDRDPRIPQLVDKVLVKEFVRDLLGPEWIIPTLWSGRTLPPRDKRDWQTPYVLKANHGSGWNVFVYDQSIVDWPSIERTCKLWLLGRYKPYSGQWAYLRTDPQLLVESYMGSVKELPIDYKFFVFSGKVHFIQVDTDRRNEHKRVFFDNSWRRQPFTIAFPTDTRQINPPASLGRMIQAAERLSEGFSFTRVDFYEFDAQPKFGEMTFYPESGFFKVWPPEYDWQLGKLWQLPQQTAENSLE